MFPVLLQQAWHDPNADSTRKKIVTTVTAGKTLQAKPVYIHGCCTDPQRVKVTPP
jgi:hypothetical protein